jgi:hypothetical protein
MGYSFGSRFVGVGTRLASWRREEQEMSKNRQKLGSGGWCGLLLGMVWLALLTAPPAWGGSLTAGGYKGASPVVILSDEFFRAMEKYANSGKVYGDRQELFLEQIATAQRFVVKTNLTLIEQNDKIIRLLEDLKRQGQGDKN